MKVSLAHSVKYEALQNFKEEEHPTYNNTKERIAGLVTHCIGTAF
jgi:phage gpG-like protein